MAGSRNKASFFFGGSEMSEAPPAADEASEFRGSAPLVATEGKREAAGATVHTVSSFDKTKEEMGSNPAPLSRRHEKIDFSPASVVE